MRDVPNVGGRQVPPDRQLAKGRRHHEHVGSRMDPHGVRGGISDEHGGRDFGMLRLVARGCRRAGGEDRKDEVRLNSLAEVEEVRPHRPGGTRCRVAGRAIDRVAAG